MLFFEPGTKHFGDSHDGNGDWSLLRFQSPIENLTLVIRDLSKKGWIDPQKAGLAGLSYGADLVDYASGFSNTFAVGSATTAEGEAPANYFILGQDGVEMFEKRWGLPYPDIKGLPAWPKGVRITECIPFKRCRCSSNHRTRKHGRALLTVLHGNMRVYQLTCMSTRMKGTLRSTR